MNFGGTYAIMYACFERKNGFYNATYQNLGASWGRWIFYREGLIPLEPSQILSWFLFLDDRRKR